jgi:two-component system LytT family response regulator
MKAIIIDDEKRARLNLSILLTEYCSYIELVGNCENLPEGVKAIHKHKPDIVFLDIEMPGHSGLELLDFFDENDIHFSIIFTTAYSEYAIQAFKLSAIDYLLKPINPEELIDAIERVQKKKQKFESLKTLKSNITNDTCSKIAVPTANLLLFVSLDDILYIKGDGSYTELHLVDNVQHVVSRNLKNFEEILCKNANFVRAHKSFIVNINFVKSYNKSDGGSLDLINGFQVPVSPDKTTLVLNSITIVKR